MRIGILLLISLFSLNTLRAQQIDFTATFKIALSEDVRIRTGGTTKTQSGSEWKKGSKVGNQTIPADTYAKMEEKLPKEYEIEVLKTGKGILRDAFITNLSTGEKVKGIYNTNTRDFLFGNITGQGNQANKNCGSFSVGVVKGKLSADRTSISNGEIGMGFVAGCKPVLISADATFFYTGTAISKP
jgi:hypothetical protein